MNCISRYNIWLSSFYINDEERQELIDIKNNTKEIEDRFFAPLEFGTAGLRGVMGMGINRINRFVVCHATQALCDAINQDEGNEKRAVICYDCRKHSNDFAKSAACVFAANGITAYMFDQCRPTPELSFAISYLGATAGINITASHNTKEYNGYKVYWKDGAQLSTQRAQDISLRMQELDIFSGSMTMPYHEALEIGNIKIIGADIDEVFLENVMRFFIDKKSIDKVSDDFKAVYTPFHGTGYKLVPQILAQIGIKNVICVEEQMKLDGDFPTVKSPNPENPESFELAVNIAQKNHADLIIGTDPDSDRIGVVAPDKSGSYTPLTGNQLGALLVHYLIKTYRDTDSMPENPALITTIVTSDFAKEICRKEGIAVFETFTGFKFMSEKLVTISQEYSYILAFEESYGYMCGDYVRDKDAVTASMLVCQMAAYYKTQSKTLHDALDELYKCYGYYCEKTVNLVAKGSEGFIKMRQLMMDLRRNNLVKIGSGSVVAMTDYQAGKRYDYISKTSKKTHISGSNVLVFELEDGTKFIVRPSGTEPKIKVYILSCAQGLDEAQTKASLYVDAANMLLL